MKHFKNLIAVILLATVIVSCNNSSGVEPAAIDTAMYKLKSDTSIVLVAIVPPHIKDVQHTMAYRIIKEDFAAIPSSKPGYFVTGVVKDSFYFYPLVDTARDDTGNPQRDPNTGQYRFNTKYVSVDPAKVIDTGLDRDSIINKLGVYIKEDTAAKK